MKPEIREQPDEIFYTWREEGIGLAFDRFRETDAGLLKAYITIESTRPERPGHVYWGQVTLSTASDRKVVVGKLESFATLGESIWEGQVDRCFQDAAQRYLKPPEPVVLADVPEGDESDYLIAPLLPANQVTLLVADQRSSKSYLLLYLGVSVAAGIESVLGPPARSGPVLYYDWETDAHAQRRRLGWICRGLGLREPPRNLHYVNMGIRGRLFDRIREMRAQVARLGAVLVVVDSLTFATGGDLNSMEFSGPTMSAIGSLGDDVTKAVAAHYAKAHRAGTNGPASAIGSALFEFKARGIWEMRRESESGPAFNVAMINRKMSDDDTLGPLSYQLAFDKQAQSATFIGARVEDSPELAERSLSAAQRIRLLLRGRQDAKGRTDEMAELLNLPIASVKTELNRMPDIVRLTVGQGRGKASEWGLMGQERRHNGQQTSIPSSPYPKASQTDSLKRNDDVTLFQRGHTSSDVTDYKASRDAFADQEEEQLEALPWWNDA